jgi:hypothetical protein
VEKRFLNGWLRGGLLTKIAVCSSGFTSSFPSAETPQNACTFLSEKSLLGFQGAFFIGLSDPAGRAVHAKINIMHRNSQRSHVHKGSAET